jgi:hypothetical protein
MDFEKAVTSLVVLGLTAAHPERLTSTTVNKEDAARAEVRIAMSSLFFKRDAPLGEVALPPFQ